MHYDPASLMEKDSVVQELFASNFSSPSFDKKQSSSSSAEGKCSLSTRRTNKKCEECGFLRERIESLCHVDAVNVRRVEVLKDTVSQIDKERQNVLVRCEKLMATIELMRMQNLSMEHELERTRSDFAAQVDCWERQLFESATAQDTIRLKARHMSTALSMLFEELEGSKRREIVLTEAATRPTRTGSAKGVVASSTAASQQQTQSARPHNEHPALHGASNSGAFSSRFLASPRYSCSSSFGHACQPDPRVDARLSPRASSGTSRPETVHCRQSLLAEMASTNEKLEKELDNAREVQRELEDRIRLYEHPSADWHRLEDQAAMLRRQLLIEQEARVRLERESDFVTSLLELSHQFRRDQKLSLWGGGDKPVENGMHGPLLGLSPVAMRTSLKLQQGYNRRHVDPVVRQPSVPSEMEGHSIHFANAVAPTATAVCTEPLPDCGEQHILDELSTYLTQVELDLSGLETAITKRETEAEQIRSLLETDIEKLLDSLISSDSPHLTSQPVAIRNKLDAIATSQKQIHRRLMAVSDVCKDLAQPTLDREDAMTGRNKNTENNNANKFPALKDQELAGLTRDTSAPGLSTERDSLSPEVAAPPQQQAKKQVQFEMPHFVKKAPSLSGSQFGTATSCDEDLFNPGAISFPTLPSHEWEVEDSDDEMIPPVPTPKARVI